MLPHTTTDASRNSTYRKTAGQEPLPGYYLIEPLGKGGFGEVWKCEAPGGLHKAIKFVSNNSEGSASNSLDVEYEAFQHIKTIRHPFLLNLERVELFNDELVMVMELADQQLQDRFRAYQHQGYPGIAREELLGYLADAAEMLDHISSRYGLQHLDIKPANLFIVCDRVKVGDFGLVRRHELTANHANADRGLTPRYVAPEILHGRVDARSDQYCLALVYQEMLTGVFPYNARSAQQMMLQHVSAAPNLSPLPPEDQYAVNKALSKAPTDRYQSCSDFINALISGQTGDETMDHVHDTWGPSSQARNTSYDIRQSRSMRRTQDFDLPPLPSGEGIEPGSLTGRMTQPPMGASSRVPQLTTQHRQPQQLNPQRKTIPTLQPPQGSGGMIYGQAGGPPQRNTTQPYGTPVHSRYEEPVELVPLTTAPPPLRLARIHSVLPTNFLTTSINTDFIAPDPNALIDSLVMAASPDGKIPFAVGAPARQLDGTWSARFPLRPISGVAKIKLELLKEAWKAEIEPVGTEEFFIRRHNSGGFWDRYSGKKNGLIVHVKLPTPGNPVGEAVLTGSLFGTPDATLTRAAEELLPEMLDEVKKVLANAEDRRKHVRVTAPWNVTMYPLTSDGIVGKAFPAKMRDISQGGLSVSTNTQVDGAYVYTVFHEIKAAANWALLTRLSRATAELEGLYLAGRFRTDL